MSSKVTLVNSHSQWVHRVYRQMAHNPKEILCISAGGHLFFPDGGHPLPPEDDDNESEYFSEEYWQVLSPVLTKLYLVIGEDEVYIEGQAWLNSMQKLQHLEIHGQFSQPKDIPRLFLRISFHAVTMCHSLHCKVA